MAGPSPPYILHRGVVAAECLLEGGDRPSSGGGRGVEQVVLQVAPDKEGQALHCASTQGHLPGLAGDGGGQLLIGHLTNHHSRQLIRGGDLSQPDELGDGEGLDKVWDLASWAATVLVVIIRRPSDAGRELTGLGLLRGLQRPPEERETL